MAFSTITILKLGDSLTTPDFGDIVNFNYSLKSLNGTTIYSEEELKTPGTMPWTSKRYSLVYGKALNS
ncbi:MAG: hypothetical protein R2802_00410 [Flavobacteriaceae bacterium]